MSETREEIDARTMKAMEREFGPSFHKTRQMFFNLPGSQMVKARAELKALQRIDDMADGIISRRRRKANDGGQP